MNADLPIGMMDQPPEVVAKFREFVASGESPKLAEWFAVRTSPVLITSTSDAAQLKPQRTIKQGGLPYMQKMREQARAAGIPITDDSFFNGSMADERQGADPEAWLHPGEGTDKYKRLCRNRGAGSPELGVECGESQERVDKAQTAIEKQRKINRERKVIEKQLARDGIVV